MTKKEVTAVGRRLKELRLKAGLTQQELAVKAGLSVSNLAQIEQGQSADPRVSTVAALASALGVNVSQLLAEDAPAPAPSEKKPKGGKGRRKKGE